MKPHRSLLLLALCFVSVVAARADDPLVIHLWEKGAPGFESRRDEQTLFAGWSRHHLVREGDALRIKLKRIDLVNCDSAFGNIQLFM